jgi:LPXTG-motif cell wall-anchored protein
VSRLTRAGAASLALAAGLLSATLTAHPAAAEPGTVPASAPAPAQNGNGNEPPSGETPTGTLAGQFWADADKDGHRDSGEDAVGGATVVVRKHATPAEPAIKAALKRRTAISSPDGPWSAITGENGKYSVDGLPAGKYDVVAIPPDAAPDGAEWALTKANVGAETADSDFEPFTETGEDGNVVHRGRFSDLTVVVQQDVTLDAGLINVAEPKTGTLCARAWNDVDRDGVRETGEAAIPGLAVFFTEDAMAKKVAQLRKAGKAAKAKAESGNFPATDEKGQFCEAGIPGDLTAKAIVTLGKLTFNEAGELTGVDKVWTLTRQDQGSDATDSDFGPAVEADDLPDIVDGKVGVARGIKTAAGRTVVVDAGMYDEKVPVPVTSASPAPGGGGSLPVTGAAAGGLLTAGGLLVAGGVALVVMGRRRRKSA